MRIHTIALIILAVLAIVVGGVFYYSLTHPQKISDKDQAEIIKLTLERALVAKEIPDYHLIKDKENIVLSTENIDPNLVPNIPGVNLILLDPDEIQENADLEGDFLYLRFEQVKVENSKVIISLDNIWAVSQYTQGAYLSGGGFTIEYHRDFFGRWSGEVIRTWIS